MSESHWGVSDGSTQVMVYVYATQDELQAEVAERIADDADASGG